MFKVNNKISTRFPITAYIFMHFSLLLFFYSICTCSSTFCEIVSNRRQTLTNVFIYIFTYTYKFITQIKTYNYIYIVFADFVVFVPKKP